MQMTKLPQNDVTQPPAGRKGPAARVVPWIAQLGVAAILAQTLFFKFTYAPETQIIFAGRGGRPMATLVGLAELVAAILLLIPRTASLGAALALLIIGGAIFTHLTSLGIDVNGDGGFLFGLAIAVATGSLVVLAFRWRQLPLIHRLRTNQA
jgi:uncharacterized membrane protein YphA (DoxX/SURF4 family)